VAADEPAGPHINAHFTVSAFQFSVLAVHAAESREGIAYMKRVRNVIVTVPVDM
jgi:hypothetical protein